MKRFFEYLIPIVLLLLMVGCSSGDKTSADNSGKWDSGNWDQVKWQ